MARECRALRGTVYKCHAKREDAPGRTDCLTAIFYVLKKVAAVELQLEAIGNMPRELVSQWKWS
ncbi:MAG TPA: hypothetical protein VHL30_00155, partial [Chlamydiales bacterium]|nr:hypothetical protein [Chlamydiales bacterium]